MIQKYVINRNANVSDALSKLEESYVLGLAVIDDEENLVGAITEGDIRRSLLKGVQLTEPLEVVMNKDPIKVEDGTSQEDLKKITDDHRIKIVPIVNNGKLVDVYTIDIEEVVDVPVVLMVGGLGSRLGDLTKNCPKPMLKVGGKPVLERILENFINVGFKKFYFTVNYKANIIEDYFGDGSKFNCTIKYVKEKKRLGTAGSLSLISDDLKGPMVVMNGDLLTMVDFRRLLHFHNQHHAPITMCTRIYDFQVPYGVVNVENGCVESVVEKPIHSVNVNAGVYVVDAKVLPYVPYNDFYDMPTLIEDVMKDQIPVSCFPMIEKWIDIGKVSDLEYARSLYGE